jgi:hypothetical protein
MALSVVGGRRAATVRGSGTGAMRYRYAVEIDPRWGS